MFVSLILIGGIAQIGTTASNWASAIMLLIWSVAYQFSVRYPCRRKRDIHADLHKGRHGLLFAGC